MAHNHIRYCTTSGSTCALPNNTTAASPHPGHSAALSSQHLARRPARGETRQTRKRTREDEEESVENGEERPHKRLQLDVAQDDPGSVCAAELNKDEEVIAAENVEGAVPATRATELPAQKPRGRKREFVETEEDSEDSEEGEVDRKRAKLSHDTSSNIAYPEANAIDPAVSEEARDAPQTVRVLPEPDPELLDYARDIMPPESRKNRRDSLWIRACRHRVASIARVWGRSLICADVHRHAQRCKLSKYVMCNHMQEAIAQAAVRQAEEAMRFGEEEDWEHGEDLEPISEGSQAAEPLIAGEHSGEDVEDVDLEEADPEDADPEDSDYDPEDDPFVWDSKLTPFPEESQATEPPIADEHSTEDVEDADLEKADLEDADLEDPEYDPEDDPFAWDSKLTFAAEDDSFATENMTAFKTTQYESHDDKQNNETGEVSNVPDSDDASFPDDPSATSSRRSHCPSPKANFVPDPFDAFDDDSSAENENTFLHDDHNAESLRRSPCLSPKVDYVPDPFDAPNDGEDTANEDAPLYGDSNAESLPLSPRFSPEDFIPDPFDAPDDGGDTEVEDEDRALHGIALPRLQDIPAWSIEGDNTVLDGEFNESLAQGNGTPHRLKPWHQGRLPIRRRPLIWRYIPEPAPVYEEEEEENWDRESTSSEEEELDNSPETDDEEDKD